jgi:tetratricopeptide (TPR) repeat protein
MLFERIRRTQKPVFIFLAVAFALGFALLGVGSSGNVNALDFLHIGGSSGDPVSKLNDSVKANPNDSAAWLRLAQAYVAKGDQGNALNAYRAYLRLRPTDASALTTAAGLLEQQAQISSINASAYQAVASYYQQGSATAPLAGLTLASGLSDPIASQIASPYQRQYASLSAQAAADFGQATTYRQSLVKADPKNAFNQELLGFDAANSRNYTLAVTAFKAYLKLAPSGTESDRVRSILKTLEPFAKSSSGVTSTP